RIATFRNLGKNIFHVPRRQKLALLDIHDTSRLGGSNQQIGLAAEKCRDLQDIDHRSNCGALLFSVDIRQHRKAELLLEIRKNFHCLFEADSTLSLQGCAIGLVEAGLVDKTDAEL